MTAPSVLDVFEAAAHDETGTLVRRAWTARVERELAAAGPDVRPAVLLADLDHFKRCNDSHGHLAGDRVLADVVWAIRSELRHVDVIGRFGGDELAVLLTGDHTPAGAVAIAERIRRRVETVQVPGPGGRVIGGLSVSIGAATPADGVAPELDSLLAAADAALYAAKAAGRNAVRGARARAGRGPHVPVAPRHAH